MKVGQIVAQQRIEFVDRPIPEPTQPGQVVVRMVKGAICGSDMPHFLYEQPQYPLPDGVSLHECIGVIAASTSKRFKEGDEVLAVPPAHRGLQEYFLTSEEVTFLLPDFDPKQSILMSQPLGTVIWALRKLGNLLLQHTVVLGVGPMGLLFTHLLSNLGAKTIIALDKLDYRLETARSMQATHTLNVTCCDVVKEVGAITGGHMADLVVEVVGHQTETLNTCVSLARRGGTILAFGVPDDEIYPYQFKQMYTKNLTLIGSVSPDVQNDYPMAIDMITQGRIDVTPMITHELPLLEAQRAFEMARDKTEKAVKILLNAE